MVKTESHKSREFVAEFTTNSFGHFGLLMRMVEAASKSGASAIKMQKKDVRSFYSQEKLESRFDSPFGTTYREYRESFEFSEDEWLKFDQRCADLSIAWFSTVQDLPSLDFLVPFEPKRVKIASLNSMNTDLAARMESLLDPSVEVVISVAGRTLSEIHSMLEKLSKFRRVWILHCVAEYPCPEPRVRLGNISALKSEFADERIRVGYSGHEVGLDVSLAAIDVGAEMIERHFCLSRSTFVHHIECALTPREFEELVRRGSAGKLSYSVDERAFETRFGMDDGERLFLEKGAYSRDFLGDRFTVGEM